MIMRKHRTTQTEGDSTEQLVGNLQKYSSQERQVQIEDKRDIKIKVTYYPGLEPETREKIGGGGTY